MADDTNEPLSVVDAVHAIARAAELNAIALIEASTAIGGLMDHIREQSQRPVGLVH